VFLSQLSLQRVGISAGAFLHAYSLMLLQGRRILLSAASTEVPHQMANTTTGCLGFRKKEI